MGWILMDAGDSLLQEVPGEVVSLDIINNKLYGATEDRGIFQISLAEE